MSVVSPMAHVLFSNHARRRVGDSLAFSRSLPEDGNESVVNESRSVDDQAEWLDSDHVLYALPRNVAGVGPRTCGLLVRTAQARQQLSSRCFLPLRSPPVSSQIFSHPITRMKHGWKTDIHAEITSRLLARSMSSRNLVKGGREGLLQEG